MSTLAELRVQARGWGLVEGLVPDGGEILFHNPHGYMATVFTCETGTKSDLHAAYLHDPEYYTATCDIAQTTDIMLDGSAITDIDTVVSIWSDLADRLQAHGLPVARTAEMVELHRRKRYNAFWDGTPAWSLADCCQLLDLHFSWDEMNEFIRRQIPITYVSELLSGEVTLPLLYDLFPMAAGVQR